jgi:hypothetical protein
LSGLFMIVGYSLDVEDIAKQIGTDIKNPSKEGFTDSEVVPPGIEPGTQGFSVLCSTN